MDVRRQGKGTTHIYFTGGGRPPPSKAGTSRVMFSEEYKPGTLVSAVVFAGAGGIWLRPTSDSDKNGVIGTRCSKNSVGSLRWV